MRPDIRWCVNALPPSDGRRLSIMAPQEVAKARAFHQSIPGYAPTPLQRLNRMAQRLGLGNLWVKDESARFGLNAFKVLGGAYAMARYIASQLGRDVSQLPYEVLTGPQVRQALGQATFFTATDGNHGRGVAWAARQLGQKAVVRMPRGSAKSRFDNIAREGAQVSVEDANYDECVRLAAAQAAQTPHGVIVQDTAWEGYEDIPAWIMQGYGTMAAEAVEQLAAQGIRPTHVLVQAGVGSLAGAVTGYLAQVYASAPPFVAVLEASAADCLYRSAAAGDGRLRAVGGDLRTIMAGLACGEGNPLGWDILRDHASAFLSCPDWVSALGMRMLAAPLPGDPPVLSGESGAVGMGVLGALEAYPALREALGLDAHAQVLLFSTEGDTDPDAYRRIVWGGECPATTD